MSAFDRGTTSRSRALEPVPTYLPGSPFHNGTIEVMQEEMAAKIAALTPDDNGMVMIKMPSEREFRIRAACQHWAPNHNVPDCRFGCAKKEK